MRLRLSKLPFSTLTPTDEFFDSLEIHYCFRQCSQYNHYLSTICANFGHMIPFKISILGCGSALPTLHRNPTSQLVQFNGMYLMIDCAEGTQLQLKKIKHSPMRINHILISHLHGDHYFGLIGLITSLHLIGRHTPLHIYGPAQLDEIIQLQLNAGGTRLNYVLRFHSLEEGVVSTIYEDENLFIKAFPVVHRIPTWGFLISEKAGERKINKDFVARFQPDVEVLKAIKSGADFNSPDGYVIPNEAITVAPHKPRSYAFCTDTAYNEDILPIIRGASVLYHEATFMHHKQKDAMNTFHSTTVGAATIAEKAGVGKLLLGHYSSRYKDLGPLLEEARSVFPETIAADDGLDFEIEPR